MTAEPSNAVHGPLLQVDKAGVVFYELTVTEQHIAEGFAVGAHSIQGSRFKLLLFEQAVDTQWELLTQVLM